MRNGVKGAFGFAALSLAAATASPAFAQMDFTATVIGATVGNAVGRGQVACIPDTAGLVPTWGPKLDQLMNRYAAASTAKDARAVRKLFSSADGGGEWVSEGVIRPRRELGGEAAAPIQSLERVGVVFGGDTWTARGVWKTVASEEQPQIFYVADFRRTQGWGIWQIWRLRRYEVVNAPTLPEHFCTFDDKVAALW